MNEVAIPCCGSCEWYCWNGRLLKYNCHNPEIVKQHKQNTVKPESLCQPVYYTPRNPSPLIAVPGVKEMVKAAWWDGCDTGGAYNTIEMDKKALGLYMKALEDNHE